MTQQILFGYKENYELLIMNYELFSQWDIHLIHNL
jgi:hypothetical protein